MNNLYEITNQAGIRGDERFTALSLKFAELRDAYDLTLEQLSECIVDYLSGGEQDPGNPFANGTYTDPEFQDAAADAEELADDYDQDPAWVCSELELYLSDDDDDDDDYEDIDTSLSDDIAGDYRSDEVWR